jgi:hypothetical protein
MNLELTSSSLLMSIITSLTEDVKALLDKMAQMDPESLTESEKFNLLTNIAKNQLSILTILSAAETINRAIVEGTSQLNVAAKSQTEAVTMLKSSSKNDTASTITSFSPSTVNNSTTKPGVISREDAASFFDTLFDAAEGGEAKSSTDIPKPQGKMMKKKKKKKITGSSVTDSKTSEQSIQPTPVLEARVSTTYKVEESNAIGDMGSHLGCSTPVRSAAEASDISLSEVLSLASNNIMRFMTPRTSKGND